ncbi:MAG: tRNA pseudouridine(55) synthase TruB [Ruminococcus sp.]|nr:tRNA pseudouridine(55) synthase TruB [Ruminococcus sp.]
MNGVLVIDKPEGFTSFDVIAVVRKLTGQRKTGHTGTLDPNATGVLPVLLGSATKAQDILPDHDKGYTAGFQLGIRTDTLDIWGEVLERVQTDVSEEEVLRAMESFRGDIMQVPPMYSAIKKNGQRLYDLARQGVEVEREARPVTVYRLSLVSFNIEKQSGVLEIECSKGTYVRSLIDDIGKKLGACAAMTSLRRTRACGFGLPDCVTLDALRELTESSRADEIIRPVESLFVTFPEIIVSDAQAKRFSNGGALDISRTRLRNDPPPDGAVLKVLDDGKSFLGLAKAEEKSGLLRVFKLFAH